MLTVLGLLALLGVGWIARPLYGPILWGCVIGLLFTPLQRRILRSLGDARPWPGLAALLALLVAVLVVLLPLALLSVALVGQAWQLYGRIESGAWQPLHLLQAAFGAAPPWLLGLLARLGLGDVATVLGQVNAGIVGASRYLATQAFGIGQNTLGALASGGIALYLAFFVLRDGAAFNAALQRAMPLAPPQAHLLADRAALVVRATVKGYLVVASVQGLLGGLAFAVLAIDSAVLWGAAMAALSLVPLVGAALVWGPVAVYLMATGSVVEGVALLLWGLLAVGLVDNLLRPRLIGHDTRLPDWAVLVSTLGGLSVFGLNGLLLGPAIAAMALTVWQMLPLRPAPEPEPEPGSPALTAADPP
ncbi:AI-2E family transporter [Leptothrix discophora]|uniref:AI-2E family transporter n=1 Tax=Leptothrix discophora TaxID=89 RepID=A0ABT9G8J3_LEPDI|nr:AI-2E family transporter [Leptothrix discophora]MDP4302804.1 AI-2E family transporter [Leptothrix discophora]